MTDGQLLFSVFAALYLIECLRWIPAHSWICVERAQGRWHFRRPSKNFAAHGIGAVLLAPLPPFRAHFVVMPWLFVPERDHLAVHHEGRATMRVAWDRINPRTEGGSIILAGLAVVRMTSESLAAEWCTRLHEWAAMPEMDREKSFLDHAAKSLDAERLKETAIALAGRTRSLRANAALILLWCFGGVSAIYAWYGETPLLWCALLALLGLQVTQAIMFWRATRGTDHRSPVPHRFWKTLSAALLPQHSVRAADHICRAVPVVPHPLAAMLLLDPVEFLADARRFWREARFRKGWQTNDALPLEAMALAQFFKSSHTGIATLEEGPPHDHTSLSFCPRCLAQFQLAAGECLDCEGVELQAFD